MTDVPESHPRYLSLKTRDNIVAGVDKGVTSIHGLIAHGRGEAFDYLLGESTHDFAQEAIGAAAVTLLLSAHPVISVNGNAAALAPFEMVQLSKALGAPLEVNIFHASENRERAIRSHMAEHGAPDVLMPTREATLDYIESNRRFVNPKGIYQADTIFVPLEDGDRCRALVKMGKSVITVDLNPRSRTSRASTVSIVDNVVRALPRLNARIKELEQTPKAELRAILATYSNDDVLKRAEAAIRSGED